MPLQFLFGSTVHLVAAPLAKNLQFHLLQKMLIFDREEKKFQRLFSLIKKTKKASSFAGKASNFANEKHAQEFLPRNSNFANVAIWQNRLNRTK